MHWCIYAPVLNKISIDKIPSHPFSQEEKCVISLITSDKFKIIKNKNEKENN